MFAPPPLPRPRMVHGRLLTSKHAKLIQRTGKILRVIVLQTESELERRNRENRRETPPESWREARSPQKQFFFPLFHHHLRRVQCQWGPPLAHWTTQLHKSSNYMFWDPAVLIGRQPPRRRPLGFVRHVFKPQRTSTGRLMGRRTGKERFLFEEGWLFSPTANDGTKQNVYFSQRSVSFASWRSTKTEKLTESKEILC